MKNIFFLKIALLIVPVFLRVVLFYNVVTPLVIYLGFSLVLIAYIAIGQLPKLLWAITAPRLSLPPEAIKDAKEKLKETEPKLSPRNYFLYVMLPLSIALGFVFITLDVASKVEMDLARLLADFCSGFIFAAAYALITYSLGRLSYKILLRKIGVDD